VREEEGMGNREKGRERERGRGEETLQTVALPDACVW